MSTSLAVEFRPKTIDQLRGNESVKKALGALLKDTKKLPHTLLFHGPTGCGKTTLARIVANALGCKSGSLHEQNTADFRGIDTVRETIRQMTLAPLFGRVSVWLLDECHQLSKDAQNALLKALEEPPEHVYFILCTTDPAKLLPTIRSRCTAFEVRPLGEEDMSELLSSVCEDLPENAVEMICEKAQGSPRTALSILEKVKELPADQMAKEIDAIAKTEAEAIELCRALTRGNWPEIAKILGALEEEPEAIRRLVLGYFSTVLLKSGKPVAAKVLEAFSRPFYDTGKPGLVLACYDAIYEG